MRTRDREGAAGDLLWLLPCNSSPMARSASHPAGSQFLFQRNLFPED
jgi:hypothetical protein